jgi:hypothetical protein
LAPKTNASAFIFPPFPFRLSPFSLTSFAPAHVALRAACARLPGRRPLARFQVSGFSPLLRPLGILQQSTINNRKSLTPSNQKFAIFPFFSIFPVRFIPLGCPLNVIDLCRAQSTVTS